MIVIPIAVYVIFSFLVAFVGNNRILGFWVSLTLCLIFTPLLIGIFLVLTSPRTEKP